MMRCSRPMSWAVASTWPSGGRRSTQRWPAVVGDREGQVRVAAGDQVEAQGRATRRGVLDEPGGDAVDVDALDLRLARLGPLRPPSVGRRLGGAPRPSVRERHATGRAAVDENAGRPRILAAVTIDVTDATFETDVLARSDERARGGRPVGAVVRAVQDARSHPREGGRRHRRPGRAGQGQRGREPAGLGRLPGAGHPRGVRRCKRRQGRRRLRRRPGRGRGAGLRRAAAAERDRDRGRRALAAGDEASLRARPRARSRQRAGHRGAGRAAGRRPASPTRPSTLLARIPETAGDPAGGGAGPGRRRGRRRRRRRGRSSTSCSTGSRATTRPARSSSTCSSCSVPTIPAPPTTAASSPPASSERPVGRPGRPVTRSPVRV